MDSITTQSNTYKQQGFTFVEIMVVLIILGVVATFATMMLSSYTGRPSLDDIETMLRVRLNAAKTQAILKPALIGIRLSKQGIECVSWQCRGQDKCQWWPISDDNISAPSLFSGYISNLPAGRPKVPQVRINPNGFATPFRFALQDRHQSKVFNINNVLQVSSKNISKV